MKTRLADARTQLEGTQPGPADPDQQPELPEPVTDEPQLCPHCKKGRLSISIRLEPLPRRFLAAINDTS